MFGDTRKEEEEGNTYRLEKIDISNFIAKMSKRYEIDIDTNHDMEILYIDPSLVVRYIFFVYLFFGYAETVNMNKLICVNEEIESISLHKLRPLLLHGYVLPFLLLYGGWFYVWVAVLGFNEYVEAGCIGFVIIGLLQVVCSLLCHWFVSVRCLLTCNRVRLSF